jgi:SAM-dependent methyltransferase
MMSDSYPTEALFDRFYYSRADFVGGTEEFHAMCREALSGAERILEVGAGPDNATTRFLSGLSSVTGVDVSEEMLGNPALTEKAVYDGRHFPFPDESFGGCVSNYVLEHVAHPAEHFTEVARVLRPGSAYVFRTPNLFHYVALAASILPHRAHVLISKPLRGMTDEDHDPWVTYYRANTTRAIARYAGVSGLAVRELRMVEKEPSYARGSAALFVPMMLYERAVNATSYGAPFRSNIFGVLVKAGDRRR